MTKSATASFHLSTSLRDDPAVARRVWRRAADVERTLSRAARGTHRALGMA
jgi:hypothetical protein